MIVAFWSPVSEAPLVVKIFVTIVSSSSSVTSSVPFISKVPVVLPLETVIVAFTFCSFVFVGSREDDIYVLFYLCGHS